jgi:hypothetical protein
MIRQLKNFKRATTGNSKTTVIENALVVCIVAFAALGSAQLLFGAA